MFRTDVTAESPNTALYLVLGLLGALVLSEAL
jgi:hypothetical protein